jgi:hypothetical protein
LKPVIRPASRHDIEAFSPVRNKPTVRAVCMEIDGRIVGLAGVALVNGRWFAFVDLKDEARPHKMIIARTAIRFLSELRRDGVRYVYAEADPTEIGAVRWMTSLGFEIDPRSDYLYRWGN